MFLTVLAAVVLGVGQTQVPETFVKPPMHRVWSAKVGYAARILRVNGDEAWFYSATGKVGAVRVTDGKVLWSQSGPYYGLACANSKSIITAGSKDEYWWASLLDFEGKHERKLARIGKNAKLICADDQTVYTFVDGNLKAISLKTGKVEWDKPVIKQDELNTENLTLWEGSLFLSSRQTGVVCLDPKTGKTRWKYADMTYYPRFLKGEILLLRKADTFAPRGSLMVDSRTGKIIWTSLGGGYQASAPIGDRIVFAGSEYSAVNLSTGALLSSSETAGGDIGDWEFNPLEAQREGLVFSNSWHIVDRDGKVVADYGNDAYGTPVYADSLRMIFSDSEGFTCFETGAGAPVPSGEEERRTLAVHLVENLGSLSPGELRTLYGLGHLSVPPILAHYREFQKTDDYQKMYGSTFFLEKFCTQADTDTLIKVFESLDLKQDYTEGLVRVLVRKGDPTKVHPFLTSVVMKALDISDSDHVLVPSIFELEATVARMKEPEAVDATIACLKRLDLGYAKIGLGSTGTEKGLKALREVRQWPKTVPKWSTPLEVKDARVSELVTGQDARKGWWRLVASGIFGDSFDLFLQHKTNGVWGDTVYTGLKVEYDGGIPRYLKSGQPWKAVSDGTWIKALRDDKELTRDSDSDGLTDMVETRLHTDPHKADTDGDGIGDMIDPCPNAAPRIMDDRDLITAEAVRVMHEWDSEKALLNIDVPGVTPFEIHGAGQFVWWPFPPAQKGFQGTNQFGQVALLITAAGRGIDYESEPVRKPFEISKDGRHATVLTWWPQTDWSAFVQEIEFTKWGDEWYASSVKEQRGLFFGSGPPPPPVWAGGDGLLDKLPWEFEIPGLGK